jgi:hypothetical protein
MKTANDQSLSLILGIVIDTIPGLTRKAMVLYLLQEKSYYTIKHEDNTVKYDIIIIAKAQLGFPLLSYGSIRWYC